MSEAESGGQGRRRAWEGKRQLRPVHSQARSEENPLCRHGCDGDAQAVFGQVGQFLVSRFFLFQFLELT